jgi:chemotaxis response regulator CheB
MRILVVAEPSMFDEGIEALLRQEPGVEIVGREEDPREALRLVKEASPDVILVADGEWATRLAPDLIRMVRQGFRMKMVEVHLATNTLCIYRGDQQRIREAGELVEAVKHICGGLGREPEDWVPPVVGQPTA